MKNTLVAVKDLLEQLQRKRRDKSDLPEILRLLAEYGDPHAIPTLATILLNGAEDLRIREMVTYVLGQIGTPLIVAPLTTVLHDPTAPIVLRRRAIHYLGTLDDARVIPSLLQILSDPEWQLRLESAEVLGGYPNASVQEALLVALTDPVTIVRRFAAQSLACLGNNAGKAILCETLQAENNLKANTRDAVAALGKLADSDIDPLLASIEATKDYEAYAEATLALAERGSLDDPERLVPFLNSYETAWAYRASTYLARHGDIRGIQSLSHLTRTEDKRVQLQAIRMVGQLRLKEALPDLEFVKQTYRRMINGRPVKEYIMETIARIEEDCA